MATLVYSDVDGVDRSFALGHDPVTVGRDPNCTIRSNDPRVSRHHARFFVDQGALWVEDLGSSNGIFVGPNKVQRAPVPTGEIILIGSLMIRLLPASGTLPPPMGLHGTLATWLDLERKTRAGVEEERDAFAKRVGELHQQIATMKQSSDTLRPDNNPPQVDGEMARLHAEAEAKIAVLERALEGMHKEVEALRNFRPADDEVPTPIPGELEELRDRIAVLEKERAEWSSGAATADADIDLDQELAELRGKLEAAESAKSIVEHAHAEVTREAHELREQLLMVKKQSTAEIDAAKLEAAKSREKSMVAETAAGMAAAEKLAEADIVITRLEREVEQLRAAAAAPAAAAAASAAASNDQIVTLTAKVEKLEKELGAAQIRAQGAERNLSGANAQAAKAETRAAQMEQKVADAEERVKSAEHDVAKALERVAQLETRLGAGDAPLQAAEARSAGLKAELDELSAQLDQRREKVATLEKELVTAQDAAKAALGIASAAKDDVAKSQAKVAEAEAKLKEMAAKLEALAAADDAIAAATKTRDEATAKAGAADARVAEAERRAADAEQRSSAADTMAKAMAKDVAEALRRAADTDTRAKGQQRDLADAIKRAADAEARMGESDKLIADAEQKAAAAAARTADVEKELTAKASEIRKELGDKLAATQKDLGAQLEAVRKELGAKLESTQRELAAERSGLLALVDRKTGLERELADARAALPALQNEKQDAEARLAEARVQIDTLQDRVTDLESGMAVSETAMSASLEEARARVLELEKQLAAAGVMKQGADQRIATLEARVMELEPQLRAAIDAQVVAESALRDAQAQLEAGVRSAEDRTSLMHAETARLRDELELEAIRANTAQMQLDEALQRLTTLEGGEQRTRVAEDRLRDAEARLLDSEQRLRSAEERLADAMDEVEASRGQLAELGRAASQSGGTMELAEQRAVTAEQRAATAEQKLAAMQGRVAALQKEVDAAENVRSFAAETEREIAQLQRDLKEARSKLTQMTLERDRLEVAVKDARGDDDDTTNRTMPSSKDLAAYEKVLAESKDLADQVKRLQRTEGELRAQLEDAEARVRAAIDRSDEDGDAESTRTGNQLPIAVAEQVGVIEEAVESLRAEMRAASDTAMDLQQTPEITAITDAVSNAQEHIERARVAVRALQQAIGI